MKANTGLTLVELLVALALMGLIFVLLTSWQASTLSLSTHSAALSHSLAEMNDTTGYLAGRLRAAVRVRVATANLSINGAACTNETPCLALVVPEDDPGGMTRYHLHTYRLEARSRVSPADKVTDPWAEANVQVLREYRLKAAAGAHLVTVWRPRRGCWPFPRSLGQGRAIRPAI